MRREAFTFMVSILKKIGVEAFTGFSWLKM
jgi:hypothetical protein